MNKAAKMHLGMSNPWLRCAWMSYTTIQWHGRNAAIYCFTSRKMKPHQLDLQRSIMIDALYAKSGRADLPSGHPLRSTYTGLWQEFCSDLGPNFRDTDYAELHADVCQAIDDTGSVMTDKQAQQAIAVCRRHLLGRWA